MHTGGATSKESFDTRKLVPANIDLCVIGAVATRMSTKTAYVSPKHAACDQVKSTAMRAVDRSPGMLAAVNCATPNILH